jgi:glycosyltransferase involved in cell wall biosynthesis
MNESNYVPKICVYTITKNEEKFAKKWAENMSEADYTVVLDTGSTDKTVEILKAEGVTVEVKPIIPWRFDVARNESMKLIPEDVDICVCTDLDELFEPGWADAIRKHWKSDTEKLKYLFSWSHDEDGNSKVQIWYEKIHDNTGNWYWAMPIHEAITHKTKRLDEVITEIVPGEEMHLHHYPDLSKSRGNYLELMELALQEEPENITQHWYYGRLNYSSSRNYYSISSDDRWSNRPSTYSSYNSNRRFKN